MNKRNTLEVVKTEKRGLIQLQNDTDYDLYVGLDVHKASIAVAVAVAEPGRGRARFRSEMNNSPKTVKDLTVRLEKEYSTDTILYC